MPRKRNRLINFRMNEAEYLVFSDRISKTNLSKEEYIRSCILNKKIVERVPIDIYKLINEVNKVGINLNQITKKMNGNVSIFEADVKENQQLVHQVLFDLDQQIRGN